MNKTVKAIYRVFLAFTYVVLKRKSKHDQADNLAQLYMLDITLAFNWKLTQEHIKITTYIHICANYKYGCK